MECEDSNSDGNFIADHIEHFWKTLHEHFIRDSLANISVIIIHDQLDDLESDQSIFERIVIGCEFEEIRVESFALEMLEHLLVVIDQMIGELER